MSDQQGRTRTTSFSCGRSLNLHTHYTDLYQLIPFQHFSVLTSVIDCVQSFIMPRNCVNYLDNFYYMYLDYSIKFNRKLRKHTSSNFGAK